jgi:hypothetical protein
MMADHIQQGHSLELGALGGADRSWSRALTAAADRFIRY